MKHQTTVNGIKLRRTLGNRWVAVIENQTYIFRPVTGWRSRRVIKWAIHHAIEKSAIAYEQKLSDAVQAAIWMEEGRHAEFKIGTGVQP